MTGVGSLPSLGLPYRQRRASSDLEHPRNNNEEPHTCQGSCRPEIRNPRELFPVRDDFIRSAWVRRARTERAQEYEELYPYFSARPAAALLRATTGHATTAVPATSAAMSTKKTEENAAGTQQLEIHTRLMPSTKEIGNSVAEPTVTATTTSSSVTDPSPPCRGSRGERRHMGVGTGPKNVAELRRAFRRLEPEKMFRAPRAKGEPIWAYWGDAEGGDFDRVQRQSQPPLPPGKRARTKDGFVLVPAKDLQELRRMEGALRRERGVLNAHCLLALNEGEVSAHRPLELTRMAVHGACGREMADSLREYRSWVARNRGGGGGGGERQKGAKIVAAADPQTALARYQASSTATAGAADSWCGVGKRAREAASKERTAELKRYPVGWRTLRWVMMKRQAELRSQAAEAAAMFAEEMEQRHKERYLEAWERRHDYDLYCVLAGQFWPLEAKAFRACSRPGKKLSLEIQCPARVIQRMWKTCWPFRKHRKRKGCIGLQAIWRGHRVRKRWRPIVRLRTRHGRRAVIHPCFSSWTRFARVRRWARRRFEEIEGHWERACFTAWAEWTSNLAAEKQRKLERAGRTLRNVAAYRSFRSWKTYTSTTRRAHQLYARAVGHPSMTAWVQYVDEARRQRKRRGAAVTIQRHARGYVGRVRYQATRTIIYGFDRLMSARRARHFLRQALAAAHRRAAEDLLQSGSDAEITVGVLREEKRLAKMQKELRAADAAVRRAVTRRLDGGWFSSTARLASRHSSLREGGGRGELRRQIKAVREEWKALEDKAAAAAAAAAALEGNFAPASATPAEDAARSAAAGAALGGTWPKLGLSRLLPWKDKEQRRGSAVLRAGSSRGDLAPSGVETRSEAFPPPTASSSEIGRGPQSAATKEGAAMTGGGNEKGGTQVAPIRQISRSAGEAEREARRRILSRHRDLAREIVVHDFDVRNPPPLKCCAPGCGATFTRDEHYLAHWDSGASAARRELSLQRHEPDDPSRPGSPPESPHREAARGSPRTPRPAAQPGRSPPKLSPGKRARTSTIAIGRPLTPAEPPPPQQQQQQPQRQQQSLNSLAVGVEAGAGHPDLGGEDVASFHLVVANKADQGAVRRGEESSSVTGFELLSAYITRVWGRGMAYNTLLFIDAVESWRRRSLTTEPAFAEGAADMRREFLCPEAPREVSLPVDTRQGLMRVLDTFAEDALDLAAAGAAEIGRKWGVDDHVVADKDWSAGAGSSLVGEGGRNSKEPRGNSEVGTTPNNNSSSGIGGRNRTAQDDAEGPSDRGAVAGFGANPQPKQQRQRQQERQRQQQPQHGRTSLVSPAREGSPASAAATAAAAAVAAANPNCLRPTSFDEAHFQALAHLCRMVGPGFWVSDLGRRANVLRLKELKRKRGAAREIVRLERRGRLANEAAEIKKQLLDGRDKEMEALVQPALEAASDSVLEALLLSTAARVELLGLQELEVIREKEMVAEAATVEAVWVVEPPLLEGLLDEEISAFCSEGEERELMALEDDWVPPEDRIIDFPDNFSTAMVVYAFDMDSIPGGEEGACQAATTIQLCWRQRSARVEARRRLAQVYVKRVGAGPGEVYYEHTITGECQWERPLIAFRLFPNSSW